MTILPTAYLPPIEYFVRILKEEKIYIEKYETYPKQTYRNRCNIYQVNGLQSLTIPVSKPNGNRTLTKDIIISFNENWQIKHWRAIESAYSKSPFFQYFGPELLKYYQTPITNLVNFNTELLHYFLSKIGLKNIDIYFTENYFEQSENVIDLRKILHPKKTTNLLKFHRYHQVFEYKQGFLPNLSILDLLFNLGTLSKSYIDEVYFNNFIVKY